MSPYGNIEIGELVTMLVEARNIDEQVVNIGRNCTEKLVCLMRGNSFSPFLITV